MKNFFKKLLGKILGIVLAAVVIGGVGTIGDWWEEIAPGCSAQDSTYAPTTQEQTYTFDVGFSVTLDRSLVEQESSRNDFYATGDDSYFAIICNRESTTEFASLEEYATLTAEANGTTVEKDALGNLSYRFVQESTNYFYYTVVRQGINQAYRVSFYCDAEGRANYEDLFVKWGNTVAINDKLHTFSDAGFWVVTPCDMEQQPESIGDVFARAVGEDFAISSTSSALSEYAGYTLEQYAAASAEANGTTVQAGKDGNPCFIFKDEAGKYTFYCAVRQGAEKFYTINFYCPHADFAHYEPLFAHWATSIIIVNN